MDTSDELPTVKQICAARSYLYAAHRYADLVDGLSLVFPPPIILSFAQRMVLNELRSAATALSYTLTRPVVKDEGDGDGDGEDIVMSR